MAKQEKIELVESIKGELKDINGLVLADFKGMSVHELEKLRKKVRVDGGKAQIIKNKILSKALAGSNITGMDPYLKSNTIVLSSKDDILKVLKTVTDYSKTNDKFIIKAGYVDGMALDKAGVIEMSKIPSRKELLGMIAGGVNSVITSFVGTLNGVLTSFIGTVEALEKKKEEAK